MRFGIHMSQKGGFSRNVKRAARMGCRSLQIFAGNPTSWSFPRLNPEELKNRAAVLKENMIATLVVHTPYLINLSAAKEELHHKSKQLLRETMERASYLSAAFVVLHIGSHRGMGFEEGLELFISTLKEESSHWPEDVCLLLENTAGGGHSLGGSLVTVGYILQCLAGDMPLGACLDTAHAWAAGYEISTQKGYLAFMDDIHRHIGFKNIRALHVNDTNTPCGTHRDRHAHLGEGLLGEEGLTAFLRNPWPEDLPAILETPEIGTDWDAVNLEKLRLYAGYDSDVGNSGNSGSGGNNAGDTDTKGTSPPEE